MLEEYDRVHPFEKVQPEIPIVEPNQVDRIIHEVSRLSFTVKNTVWL